MGIFGNKKRGFTVAEMAVAVAIIGLLAALLIPMAVSQFKRGDEYYYFMTYKTLEKISGQIVNVPTIEDYEEESASISPKDDSRIVYETPKDGLNDALYSFKDIIADILNAPAYAEDAYDLNSDTGIVYSYPLSSYPEMLELIGYECVCHQRCFADALNGHTVGGGDRCPKFEGKSMADISNAETGNKYYYETCPNPDPYDVNVDTVYNSPTYQGFRNRFISLIAPALPYIQLGGEVTPENSMWNKEWACRSPWNDTNSDRPTYGITKSTQENCGEGPYDTSEGIRKLAQTDAFKESFEARLYTYYNLRYKRRHHAHNTAAHICNPVFDYSSKAPVAVTNLSSGSTAPGEAMQSYTRFTNNGVFTGNPKDDANITTYDDGTGYKQFMIPEIRLIRAANPSERIKFSYDRIVKDPKIGELPEAFKLFFDYIKSYERNITEEVVPAKFETDPPKSKCESFPYRHMREESGKCVCEAFNYSPSINDPLACVKYNAAESKAGKVPYFSRIKDNESPTSYDGIYCFLGKFNVVTGECCKLDQVYNASTGSCVNAGAKPYQLSFFINDAKQLCNAIKDNWHVKGANCSTFEKQKDGKAPSVYKALFESVKFKSNYNSSKSYSINSIRSLIEKRGAFNTLTPNIVFTNGVKLWISGDRAASIPGLTYNSDGVSSTQNMCVDVGKNSNLTVKDADSLAKLMEICSEPSVKNQGGYFCASDRLCYSFNHNIAKDAQALDARSCCLSNPAAAQSGQNSSSISGFTVYADINGADKGTGTLWDDVFPFYITTNGKVIPAYPLDASKKIEEADSMTTVFRGGNDSSYLSVDVYYHQLDSVHSTKRRVLVSSNISYARGVCVAGIVPNNSPYCKNLFYADSDALKNMYAKERNECIVPGRKCYVTVRNKTKIF